MTQNKFRCAAIAAVTLACLPQLAIAMFVKCSATDLMLGEVSGAATKPYGQNTYTYSGGYTLSFKCGGGDDASICKLCIRSTLYISNNGGWDKVVGNPNPLYSTSVNGSACGASTVYQQARQIVWSNIPDPAVVTFYKVEQAIQPYPSIGDCENLAGFNLTSVDEFSVD